MKTLLTVLFLAWATPTGLAQGAFLGVELDAQSPETGARVATVQVPSAASLMGLVDGDVIVGFDAQEVSSSTHLIQLVSQRLPGEIVTIEVLRGVDTVALQGLLGRRPGDRTVRPSSPRMPALPTMPELPAMPELPPMPAMPQLPNFPDWPSSRVPFAFDWGADFEMDAAMEDVQRQLDAWRQQWQGFEADGWMNAWPRMDLARPFGESFAFPEGEHVQQRVELRYPADTPEEERPRLLEEARAQYGEDVSVRFEGAGTSISIQRSTRSGQAGAAPTPPSPPALPPVRDEDEI